MQSTNLDITPGGVKPRVHVSQYDVGRELTFTLYDGAVVYSIPSEATVTIDGIKPDMHGFSYAATWSGSTVSVVLSQQMTVLTGDVECEIRVKKGTLNIGSANFQMIVESSPINDDTIISDTDLPLIIALATAQMEAAAASAKLSESWAVGGTQSRLGEDTNNSKYFSEQSDDNAVRSESWAVGGTGTRTGEDTDNSSYYAGQSSHYASASSDSAEDSEAWAKGTRDGDPVASGDEAYHNNSKYFSEQSSGSATLSESWAVGGTRTRSGENTNNSEYFAGQAEDSATLSESWARGGTNTRTGEDTNNSEYYSTLSASSAADAKAEADRAEAYADFVTPHFIIANNRLYLKDDAVPEFIVANNRLYIKLAA